MATIAYIFIKNPVNYRLDWLCLMLWGLAIMVLVDHSIGFITEGGEFIEMTTEGYIENGALLGAVMLIPIFIVWEIAVLVSRARIAARENTEGR
jgi:uncharacterized membrane protein